MARKEMLLTFYFLLALCLVGLGETKFRRPRKRDFEEIGGDFEWEEIGGGGGHGCSYTRCGYNGKNCCQGYFCNNGRCQRSGQCSTGSCFNRPCCQGYRCTNGYCQRDQQCATNSCYRNGPRCCFGQCYNGYCR